jgi:hypothetical protein
MNEILDAWESALPRRPAGRALALLEATSELGADRLAALSLGQRDRLLFALREQLFGPELVSLAECPKCAATVQFSCNTHDLAAAAAVEPTSMSTSGGDDDGRVTRRFVHGEHEVVHRLLDSTDLLSLSPSDTPEAARRRLIDRCVLRATRGGVPIAAGDLPADVRAALVQALGKADDGADLQMSFICAACGATWEARFDIVRYLWSEIEAWSHRILAEVHTLARRYGWSERAILSMSPWRRQLYLEFGDS